MVTGHRCRPSLLPPPVHASFFITHRVQYSPTCQLFMLVDFHRILGQLALARFPLVFFFRMKKVRTSTSMHLEGFEPASLPLVGRRVAYYYNTLYYVPCYFTGDACYITCYDREPGPPPPLQQQQQQPHIFFHGTGHKGAGGVYSVCAWP